MLVWFFVVMLGLALWHFVYEGIIAPSRRFAIRLDSFALRDEVRSRMIERSSGSEEFADVEQAINTTISLCAYLSWIDLIMFKRAIEQDPKLKAAIEERRCRLEGYEFTGELQQRSVLLVVKALTANSGGWLVFVVPPLLAWLSLKYVSDTIYSAIVTPFQELQVLMGMESSRQTAQIP